MGSKESNYGNPLIFNMNLGKPLNFTAEDFSQTNADGRPYHSTDTRTEIHP